VQCSVSGFVFNSHDILSCVTLQVSPPRRIYSTPSHHLLFLSRPHNLLHPIPPSRLPPVLSDVFLLGDFTIFEALKTFEQDRDQEQEQSNSTSDDHLQDEDQEEEEEEEEIEVPVSPSRALSFMVPSPLSISSEASALCLSLTGQVLHKMPPSSSSSRGLSHAQVTVTPLPKSGGGRASFSLRSGTGTALGANSSFSKSAAYSSHYLACNLSIELHYPKPLSDVITCASLAEYNDILRFLLPISTAKWAADGAWILCMRSDLFLKGKAMSRERDRERARERSKRANEVKAPKEKEKEEMRLSGVWGGRVSIVTGLSASASRELSRSEKIKAAQGEREKEGGGESERKGAGEGDVASESRRATCRAGMSLMIHTLSVLQTHYMGIIHGHILPLYCSSSSSSSALHPDPHPVLPLSRICRQNRVTDSSPDDSTPGTAHTLSRYRHTYA
jgi:hypothetical protein